MKIVFLSNYFNHHQKALSDCLARNPTVDYFFIETQPMEAERIAMGWNQQTAETYLIRSYSGEEERRLSQKLIDDADVVVFGSAPYQMVVNRLSKGKLTFRYAERPFKKECDGMMLFLRTIKYYFKFDRYKNMYLLCSSAFTALDYSRTHAFIGRAYKWGYFPFDHAHDICSLLMKKDTRRILWCGRFLDWKHPDDVLLAAKRLKEAGYEFCMDIAGTGTMETRLKEMAESLELMDRVTFLGPVPSAKVRDLMEQAGIYLFTSDRNEGWGAVLNESMNSGCAVVASHAIGAVPYLMKHNENGLIYHACNVDELFYHVKYLLDNPSEQKRLGKAAYETIEKEWNAAVAACRLVELSEHLLAEGKTVNLYEHGPCSQAEIVNEEWF